MIHVVGAGSIGSFLAARLALAGQEVRLIARGSRAQMLKREGISLHLGEQITQIPIAVARTEESLPRPDFVVACIKTPDIEGALERYRVVSADPPVFVTVQNGVDAPQLVQDKFPHATILAARVHGFFEQDDTVVRHIGVEPSLHFGVWKSEASDPAVSFLASLQRAGVGAQISGDIEADLWAKFLLASSLGGVGSALGLPAGRVLADGVGASMLESAMREIATLAALRDVKLPGDIVNTTMRFVAGFPADSTTSLQRDLESGRRSEFDHLVGAVLRMSRECSFAVPVHQAIVRRLMDRGFLSGHAS